jgi:hypothetical protein
MRYFVSALLVIVGLIHILPLSGALGDAQLSTLYGLSFDDPNIEILMRHRAVLFGLLGTFLLFAAFQPALQFIAFIAGFASVVSFLYLGWSVGGYNAEIGRVYTADLVAFACLVLGAAIKAFMPRDH